MNNIQELKGIKKLLSGEKNIKLTPKGIRYKFFHHKKRNRDKKFMGRGQVSFFYDFGARARFTSLKYDLIGQKFEKSRASKDIWFKIVKDRMVISDNSSRRGNGQQYKIISNNPAKIDFSAGKKTTKQDNKLKILLLKWAAKNGVQVNRKWYKYSFFNVCFLLCYPEYEFFLDFKKISTITSIQPCLSSHFRGIKGLNHGLDRFCGFHGKKLKSILLEKNDVKFLFFLETCKTLKGLVTSDDLLSLKDYIFLGGFKSNRYFLKNFGRETIMNWLTDDNSYLLRDAAAQYYKNHKENPENKISLPNGNNIQEIHDVITRNYRRLELQKTNKLIDYGEINEKYKDYEFEIDGLNVRLPKDSQELIDASGILNNCLTGYTHQHGHGLIILLINDKYAISIRGKTLEQFYGKHNGLPDQNDYKKVVDYLREKDMIKESRMDSRLGI